MQELQAILPVGSVIQGRYMVENLLGKGGFGAVYLVRDLRVRQNLFALKEVIDPNKRERERFTFEAELLKRVDHQSLPRVYRVFEDDKHDRAYMLMDYIEGPNLEVLRQRQPNKRFSVRQVLNIMGPIIDAVQYLHDQRPPVIHRDIKPSNIIVPNSGDQAVLVDFGIAKVFDPESTTTAVRHASPGYGAPEQYGMGTNTRTDIYGLGATIYTLLTGVVPTDAFYRTTQLGSKGTDPLESIQQHAPDVPQHITDAVYRAMAVDGNERFPTARDFWEALNAQPVAEAAPAALAAMPAAFSRPAVVNTPAPPLANTTTVAYPRPGGRSDRRKIGALLLLLALLIGVVSALVLVPALLRHPATNPVTTPTAHVQRTSAATVTHKPTVTPTHGPTSTTTATPAPSRSPTSPSGTIPILGNTYNGTIHNTPADVNANMSMQSIKQNGGNISGNVVITGPLLGSGPFTGTINAARMIQFTVRSPQVAPLFFQGSLRADGSLSGTYCSLDATGKCDPAVGGYGTWIVFPASPGSGSYFSLSSPFMLKPGGSS